MKIGMVTDLLAHLSYAQMLDMAEGLATEAAQRKNLVTDLNGWLSTEYEDVMSGRVEGVKISVALLQNVMPFEASAYKQQAC